MMKRSRWLAALLLFGCLAVTAPESGIFALQGGTQKTAAHLEGGRYWLTAAHSQTPIRTYDIDQTKYMHVIAITDDFRTFAHVHATPDAAGFFALAGVLPSWTQPYHLYFDGEPNGIGQQVFRFDMNGADATPRAPDLSGSASLATLPPYVVRLSGRIHPGMPSMLTIHITKNGAPAPDLHPYLGALAHAVFIDASDLSYVHVHPMAMSDMDMGDMTMPALPENATSAPDMMLHVELHEPGTYKLWLQFNGGGKLYVAPFVLTAS